MIDAINLFYTTGSRTSGLSNIPAKKMLNNGCLTTLPLGFPFTGRHQIEREASFTFHMALAYFCDIRSLLCNNVCVQVNLLCATYCILPAMVFHSTIKLYKYVPS